MVMASSLLPDCIWTRRLRAQGNADVDDAIEVGHVETPTRPGGLIAMRRYFLCSIQSFSQLSIVARTASPPSNPTHIHRG